MLVATLGAAPVKASSSGDNHRAIHATCLPVREERGIPGTQIHRQTMLDLQELTTLTSCFHPFIVSWYSCWFLSNNMLMTSRLSTYLFRSKSCRIFNRTMEGGTERA